MKLRNMVAPVVFGALSLAVVNANAVNTEAGKTITNTATLSYQVNSTDQTPVSANNDLAVDAKIDLTLNRTDNTASGTAAGDVKTLGSDLYYVVGEFKLKNTGNADSYFTFSATNAANDHLVISGLGAVENNKNTKNNANSDFVIFAETGATAGLSADDTNIADLTDGQLRLDKDLANDQIIYVAALTSNVQGVDDDLFGVDLTAQVAAVDFRNAADDADSKQNVAGHNSSLSVDGRTLSFVYADTDNNALEVASDVLQATLPDFTPDPNNPTNSGFAKTSSAVWDPINADSDAKAIPSSTIKYTITIRNTGDANATNLVVTDDLSSITQTLKFCSGDGSVDDEKCENVTVNTDDGNGGTFPSVITKNNLTSSDTQAEVTFANFPSGGVATITFTAKVQ